MTPDVQLCAEALLLLGAAPISGFDDGSASAQIAMRLWPGTRDALLACYPWRCTLAKARLARLSDAPKTEWAHAFALPPDLLTVRALFTANVPGARPLAEYELFDGRLYANAADVWIDYQRASDPDAWPAHLRQLARYALAAEFAMPVTEQLNLADLWHRKAWGTPGEGKAGGEAAVARRIDAQQQPPQVIDDYPLIAARLA